MSILNLLRPNKTVSPVKNSIFTAEEIHLAMTLTAVKLAKTLSLIEGMRPYVPPEIENAITVLKSASMTSSDSYKQLISAKKTIEDSIVNYDNVMETMEFVKEMRVNFGEESLLVTYDDFYNLLTKYNLYAGKLESFTGEIPLEIAANIVVLKENKLILSSSYKHNLRRVYSVRHSGVTVNELVKIREKLDRFPFINTEYDSTPMIDRVDIYDKFGIDITSGSGYIKLATNSTRGELFIAAPKAEMNVDIEYSSIPEPKNNIQSKDPFVFFLTKYGVCIINKWGHEAEDEIFNQYNDLINLSIKNSEKK